MQQRLFAVEAFLRNHESFVATRCVFLGKRNHFNLASRATPPNKRSISKWVENFRQHGNDTLKKSSTRVPGMVTFGGHPAHLILIPATSSYGGIGKGWLMGVVTNMIRNFNDRLQECINVEERYLPGLIFRNYLLSKLPIKLSIFSYKVSFISF